MRCHVFAAIVTCVLTIVFGKEEHNKDIDKFEWTPMEVLGVMNKTDAPYLGLLSNWRYERYSSGAIVSPYNILTTGTDTPRECSAICIDSNFRNSISCMFCSRLFFHHKYVPLMPGMEHGVVKYDVSLISVKLRMHFDDHVDKIGFNTRAKAGDEGCLLVGYARHLQGPIDLQIYSVRMPPLMACPFYQDVWDICAPFKVFFNTNFVFLPGSALVCDGGLVGLLSCGQIYGEEPNTTLLMLRFINTTTYLRWANFYILNSSSDCRPLGWFLLLLVVIALREIFLF